MDDTILNPLDWMTPYDEEESEDDELEAGGEA